MREWLLRKLGALGPETKLVKVKSWRPSCYWVDLGWYRGLEIGWPTMLVQRRGGGRETSTTIWWPRYGRA